MTAKAGHFRDVNDLDSGVGDGKIFVMPLDQVILMRTVEMGKDAV